MTLKNTSHTSTYSLFLHFLQCGPVPYPSSPKLGLFPESVPLEGTWPVSATRLFRDRHHCLPDPQPHGLGSSEKAVLSHSSQEAEHVCLFKQFYFVAKRHGGFWEEEANI